VLPCGAHDVFVGQIGQAAGSDLRCYLTWCADRNLDPFLPGARTWSGTSG
jgi:hypothetical protein